MLKTLEKIKIHATLTLVVFSMAACHSAEKAQDSDKATPIVIGSEMDSGQYSVMIKKYTQHTAEYDGFYNKFEASVVFINSTVEAAILQRKSEILEWDEGQARKEREKNFQENSIQTKFILSLFTPSIRLNDLNKPNSIWRLYLEANGKRYDGKVTRMKDKLEDLQALFPFYNRWSYAYEVVFNVPLTAIENAPVVFTMTSSLGAAKFTFQ